MDTYKGKICVKVDNLVSVAQWIAHQTSNLGVVGSSPIVDDLLHFILLISI
jgi:hypothetical protein